MRVNLKTLEKVHKTYPLIMVDWLDHTADSRWVDDIKESKYAVCRTIGWLVDEDTDVIKIANAITHDSGMGGISVILRNCIVNQYEIDMND
tara:strand:+ start:2745 stop:3017 length:273 start_codon:yes stop_codon:yes gene_type:complete